MKVKAFIFILSIFPVYNGVHAQETLLNCTDSLFCIPGIMGLPRAKGIVIRRESTLNYGIKSQAENPIGDASGEIQNNSRWEFKLRAPILNKPNFKIAFGVTYFVEESRFENSNDLNYGLYDNLERRNLKSLRGELFFVKPTVSNRYFLLRIGVGLNGDFNLEENIGAKAFLRYSISPLIGWKKKDNLSYAVGIAYAYSFGKRSVFPLLSYNYTFNQNWGVESILPIKVKLRYNTTDQKNYFYLKSELNGANYGVRLSDVNDGLAYLDKSEFRTMVVWEREIHDWLWFGIEAGYRENINYDISDSFDIDSKSIIRNKLNGAFIWNLNIFLVPPRKFLK